MAKSGFRLRQKIHSHPPLSTRITSLKPFWSVTGQTKPPNPLCLHRIIYNLARNNQSLVSSYSYKEKLKNIPNPELKQAVLLRIFAHQTHCLPTFGHKSSIYRSTRSSFLSEGMLLQTCTECPVSVRIEVVFGWWWGQPCVSPNPKHMFPPHWMRSKILIITFMAFSGESSYEGTPPQLNWGPMCLSNQ